MKLVLQAMADVGAKKICFTDSIGSYGTSAPRRGATARWLTENPTQDPGSDYGLQKRAVRELLSDFQYVSLEILAHFNASPAKTVFLCHFQLP